MILTFYPLLNLKEKSSSEKIQWESFNVVDFNRMRQRNYPILLNFTAEWCVTCKFNQWNSFSNKKLIQFLKNHNIKTIQGDWTSKNPEISMILNKYGRAGIPFTAFFPVDQKQEVILPEILTPQILIDTIQSSL